MAIPPERARILGPASTLRDLEQAVRSDLAMDGERRRQIAAGIRKLALAVGRPPAEIPASPRLLNAAIMASEGYRTEGAIPRWCSMRRLARAAIERWGLSEAPGRYWKPLRAEWKRFYDNLQPPLAKIGLSRFVHYASANRIRPALVDGKVLEAFLEVMVGEGLVVNPATTHRITCRFWNKAAAASTGRERLSAVVLGRGEAVKLTVDCCPASLRADLDDYLAALADPHCAIGRGTLRPKSLYEVNWTLGAYVSELLNDGVDPSLLRTAADMVAPKLLRRALKARIGRSNGGASVGTGKMAAAVALLARRWVRLPDREQLELDGLRRRMTPPAQGISAGSTRLLRQFDDSSAVTTLVKLPQRLLADAARRGPNVSFDTARLAESAVAIELLLSTPVRLGELALLDVRASFPRGLTTGCVMVFKRHGFLNTKTLEVPLGAETRLVLRTYLKRYHAILGRGRSLALFPGQAGRPKHSETIRRQIAPVILEKTGLRMSPAQFPHFAAKHYLLAHPGDFEAVRAAVGHVSAQTTCRVYAHMDATAAARLADVRLSGRRRADALTRVMRAPSLPDRRK